MGAGWPCSYSEIKMKNGLTYFNTLCSLPHIKILIPDLGISKIRVTNKSKYILLRIWKKIVLIEKRIYRLIF